MNPGLIDSANIHEILSKICGLKFRENVSRISSILYRPSPLLVAFNRSIFWVVTEGDTNGLRMLDASAP